MARRIVADRAPPRPDKRLANELAALSIRRFEGAPSPRHPRRVTVTAEPQAAPGDGVLHQVGTRGGTGWGGLAAEGPGAPPPEAL